MSKSRIYFRKMLNSKTYVSKDIYILVLHNFFFLKNEQYTILGATSLYGYFWRIGHYKFTTDCDGGKKERRKESLETSLNR